MSKKMIDRITPEFIESKITNEQYWTPEGSLTTFVLVQTQNNVDGIGWSSCADPKKYSLEEGKKWSRKMAIDSLWTAYGTTLKHLIARGIHDDFFTLD